jgi:hypothetical protein
MFRVVTEVVIQHEDESVELVDFCVFVDGLFSRVWRFWKDLVTSPLPHGTVVMLCNEDKVLERLRLPAVDNPHDGDPTSSWRRGT